MSQVKQVRQRISRRWGQLSPYQQSRWMAVRRAFANFMRDGITGTAASGMAYYFMFSIFPLTLLVAVIVGRLLGPIFAQEEISYALGLFLPADAVRLFHDNIGYVLGNEQSFGIAAIAGLTWASLGILAEVTRVLDNIFNVPIPRSFIQQRLIGLLMMFVMVAVIGGMFLTLTVLRMISLLALEHNVFWVAVALRLMPFSLSLLIFALLLHNIPNCSVEWNAVWPSAIVGALGWEAVRFGVSYYIGHVARYSMVYGSIAVVMVLMLWAYCTALVFLLAAELCARLNETQEGAP
ncbi:MAG: YihY/virulence factor BrkB family protein [Phototrophicaceae bacterium]|jgi:membrane protein